MNYRNGPKQHFQHQHQNQHRHHKDSQGTTHENNAVPWETIQQWIQSNPKKNSVLPSYKPVILPYEDIMEPVREAIVVEMSIPVSTPAPTYDFEDALSVDSVEETEHVHEDTNSWKSITMAPICPVGLIFYGLNPKVDDEYYLNMKETERRTHHRNFCLTAQTTGYERIKNRKFPKAKTTDAILKACFEEDLHKWDPLCWETMVTILEVQLCLIDEQKKSVQMYPEDVRTWTKEKPVYFGSPDARYFYKPPEDYVLLDWVTSKVADGYRFVWPEHDDKVETLKEICQTKGWLIPDKTKKADLIAFVGKQEAFEVLKEF